MRIMTCLKAGVGGGWWHAMYRHAAMSPCLAVSARGLVVATKWAGNRGPIAARGGRRAGLGTGAIQGQHPPTLA